MRPLTTKTRFGAICNMAILFCFLLSIAVNIIGQEHSNSEATKSPAQNSENSESRNYKKLKQDGKVFAKSPIDAAAEGGVGRAVGTTRISEA